MDQIHLNCLVKSSPTCWKKHTYAYSSVQDVCQDLELAATFQVKGTIGLIDSCQRFFGQWMTDSKDIEEHIQRTHRWFQQINNIVPGSCTEADCITSLIASLPCSWDTFTQLVDSQFDLDDKNTSANAVNNKWAHIMVEVHWQNTQNDSGKNLLWYQQTQHQ